MRRRCVAVVVVAALGGGACAHRPTATDRKIEFYEAKIAASPRHYPSHALLAGAELEKARETLDPAWLARARASAAASMSIQPNFEAMKASAAVAAYSHRFADALAWARKAHTAYPADPSAAAIVVEARLGLGEVVEAERALSLFSTDGFHASCARGLVRRAQGRTDEAAAAYESAAAHATRERARDFELFAIVSAAGVRLDSGDPGRARPYLDRAAAIDAADRRLRAHETEWLEATGARREALAAVEALLEEKDDPDLRRRAARLAREAGDGGRAATHFEVARALYRRSIDAGEVYGLEGLSLLLAEAGVDLDEAVALAERNLAFKRDAAAHDAAEFARARRGP